ncbi:MAG: PilN domain-containing protein [Gammaproteobacteria bacterium]|nr:PilN domain-containing protein [Gammaproteobacteria bacterium]
MPRINLLPWRDELRNQRRNQFYAALGGAAVAAGILLLLGYFAFSNVIDHQRDRNNVLKKEIAMLDKRIEEIIDLEEKKERLLARMQIIEQLQRSRPGIVHVFDELVRTLPDGVFLTEVKQTGQRLEIVGSAESNTRVSALMRNIDKSDWVGNPDLEVVEVKSSRRGELGKASEFTVFARQTSPNADAEEEESE